MEIPPNIYTQAVEYLQKSGDGGLSAYDHLTSLIEQLLEEAPESLERFEDFSRLLKSEKFAYSGDVADKIVKSEEEEKCLDREKMLQNTFRNDGVVGNEADVEDLNEQFYHFATCGVSLPTEEVQGIQSSLYVLAKQQKLKEVRFFGKILGSEGNYYVCESNYVSEDEGKTEGSYTKVELPSPAVPKEDGEFGTNAYTYWVCSFPGDDWKRLPDVVPGEIAAAKRIQKYFTGNLKAKVVSYPSFPGLEENYLRAQIARICAATTLAPKGSFDVHVPEEEEPEEDAPPKKKEPPRLVRAEEFEGIDAEEPENLENFIHLRQYILNSQNRCTKYVPPKKGEEEEEEPPQEEEGAEEEIPMLTSIATDNELYKVHIPQEEESEENADAEENENVQSAWAVRVPLKKDFPQLSPVLLESLRWPGAFSFFSDRGTKFGNVYIGNGAKFNDKNFVPASTVDLLTESDNLLLKEEPRYKHEQKLLTPLEEDEEEISEEEKEED